MQIRVRRSVAAGIAGGILVVAAVRVAGWLVASEADLCTLAGAVLLGRIDAVGWLVGAAAQLVIAIVAALVYALVFEWVTRRAGALIGLAIGLPHVVIAGLAMGFIPAERMLDLGIGPPGAFLEYRGGWVAAAFVLAHLAFGAIVGTWYGKTRYTDPRERQPWREVIAEEANAPRIGS
jgi:hypothetical protein